MTPSDKPQRSDSQSQKDTDSTSVMTQAVDDNSTGTQAGGSTEHDGGLEGATAAVGETEHTDSTGARATDDSGKEELQSSNAGVPGGTGTPPPWQRTSSASVAGSETSEGSGSGSTASAGTADLGTGVADSGQEAGPESDGSAPRDSEPIGSGVSAAATTGAESPRAEAGTAEASTSDAEDTQTIPHPLRDMGQPAQAGSGAAAGAESAESSRTERTTVSFAGGADAAGSTASRSSASGSAGGARRPSRGPRRASLQIRRVDPWSVLKLALVLSVAMFFVWMIAVAVLYGVLGGMGVWDQLNGTFSDLTQPENTIGEPLISAGRVFGAASIVGAVNIVLMTALATVGAFIYNVAADFAGGAEVTLSERE